MTEAFICDAIRTPVGRYGGILAKVRADDLGAVPVRRCSRAIRSSIRGESRRCSTAAPTSPARTTATSRG